MKSVTKLLAYAVVASALPLASCHRSRHYESTVEITRVSGVGKDETGKATTTDLEFSYVECPGTQIETIRGGAEFSECVKQFKVGDKVKVKIDHHWDPEGEYQADVYEVQGCKRPPDPNDEASFKVVRDCSDWIVNGARVGFECKYTDKKALNKKCPWFVTR